MGSGIFDDSPRDLVFERLFDAIAAAKSSGETTLYAVLRAVLEAREAGEIGRVQAALSERRLISSEVGKSW